ncbi:lipopolysaccharide heptosyltransferase I [Candidatus Parabeggiatoa sp. HSG14]|uniref:lipopolysaccharide heptosyltransferase I n=1 Tax=Candidatus Parabeggiatoa sp. HSG14 TaxID=3055593 RepID=UPI0025A92551|nr:lipopolysaccharide heptosyltransferase I [Thiotrichales bacterium HSG14]
MRILIIKTSSLGDVIHTLPAITDAYQHYPDLQCDWVVEEGFAEIPTWHPAVKHVIKVALRQWRKHPWQTWFSGTWNKFTKTLTQKQYDKVIDAQGLIKSAFLTNKARGLRCGLDRNSAREPLAALAYQQRYSIPKNQHAVTRVRQLFAMALNYPVPDTPPDYGIANHFLAQSPIPDTLPILVFLHGTTWVTKHWPLHYWITLAQRVTEAGFTVRLPWNTPQEYERAQQISEVAPNISLIPKGNLHSVATVLAQSRACVGVDTGLAHLAAALAVPSITLYGATQASRTGTYGKQQKHLQAYFPCVPCLSKKCTYQELSSVFPACYENLSVEKVWEALQKVIICNNIEN